MSFLSANTVVMEDWANFVKVFTMRWIRADRWDYVFKNVAEGGRSSIANSENRKRQQRTANTTFEVDLIRLLLLRAE